MNIFKKKTVETSNDYYEAYKAELSGKVEMKKSNFFSLSKMFKLEILVVALGLFVMNQNGFSLELKKMYVTGKTVLPVSMQADTKDNDLVVTLEDTYVEKVIIREDTQNDMIEEQVLDQELYVENSDIKLLIELLQSEMEAKKKSVSANRIIISQK